MWRRAYLLLVLVRLYFALQPSYIHPDEHFQGPEVVAGHLFGWNTTRTWEFTEAAPIRSVFPLWLLCALPMQLLGWMVPGDSPSPVLLFYALRVLFFVLSFVLEDWALQELVGPRRRRTCLLLFASSYVTWTYQTHTFSNAVETIQVLWSLALMDRILKSKSTAWLAAALLGFTAVFGVFTRITFPAFLLAPGCRLVPRFVQRPGAAVTVVVFGVLTALAAVYVDTLFYHPEPAAISLLSLRHDAVLTPLNNLRYNSVTSNLAQHGLHARWTHVLVNLPSLLGPLLPPILTSLSVATLTSLPMLSVLSGVSVLSAFAHQEARFLLPCVPLLLTAAPPVPRRVWIAAWVLFNAAYGILMGVYHQGGVVPAQAWLAEQPHAAAALYWRTYPPPRWLLGERSAHIAVVSLEGAPVVKVVNAVRTECARVADSKNSSGEVFLAAPWSSTELDELVDAYGWERAWYTSRHLNLDDLEVPDRGLKAEVERVWGRRGLAMWKVACERT